LKNNVLISKLKEFNPDADVTTPYSEDICIGYIDNGGEFDKQNTPIVFIEMCDDVWEEYKNGKR